MRRITITEDLRQQQNDLNKIFLSFIVLLANMVVIVGQAGFSKQFLKSFGQVKSIHTEIYEVKRTKGKWIEGEQTNQFDTNFSQDKTKIESTIGENFRKEIFSLNEKGQIFEWNLFENDGRHSGTKSIYSYDNNGQLSEIIHYLLGELSHKEKFTFLKDKKCSKLERTFFFGKRTSQESELNCYDKNENVTSSISYESNGLIEKKERFKYDKRGNVIEFLSYDPFNKLQVKEIHNFTFDGQGNWTKEEMTSVDWIEGKKNEQFRIQKRTISYY